MAGETKSTVIVKCQYLFCCSVFMYVCFWGFEGLWRNIRVQLGIEYFVIM